VEFSRQCLRIEGCRARRDRQDGVTSGVSTRAPVSMRVRFEPPPPAAPAIIEAHEEAAATLRPEDDISLALLGGPETDHDLRLSLRN
jgi:hypothetical protein